MEGVTPRFLPDFPYFSAFVELNLRLYVEAEGKPGVWFLSLDASNIAAVMGARAVFNLPYFHASMRISPQAGGFEYDSRRRRSANEVRFRGRYRPVGTPYESRKGTLENWLTERYCLYAQTRSGKIRRLEVHHVPWPLQKAEAEIEVNGLAGPHGFDLPGSPALLHFSPRIDVALWGSAEIAA
jgi:uncharacterized protein YqjF (DUF2071 family)